MTENFAELTMILIVMVGVVVARRMVVPAFEYAGSSQPQGRAESWLLLLLVIATLVMVPLIDALVPWLEFAEFRFQRYMAWGGLAMGCAALTVFILAEHARLQARRSGAPIMEYGIYRYIRHPLYSALLLGVGTQWLLLQNWLAGSLATLAFVLVYLLRVPRDEQVMLERFGHRYLSYMDRTGALWPRIGRY